LTLFFTKLATKSREYSHFFCYSGFRALTAYKTRGLKYTVRDNFTFDVTGVAGCCEFVVGVCVILLQIARLLGFTRVF
jgi:hypothetical protein